MRSGAWGAFSILVAVFAATAFGGGIVGTGHDFSSEVWSEGRICLPCHVPHDAQTDDDGSTMVLWNHSVTNETFTMYSGFVLERLDRDQDEQPGGASKLCLSCHDGATAVDAFGGGPESPSMYATDTSLGTDLRDDHPIGIQYPPDGLAGFKPRANLSPVKLVSWGGRTDRVERGSYLRNNYCQALFLCCRGRHAQPALHKSDTT